MERLICYRCQQPWENGACGCADGCCVVWGDCREALPLLPKGAAQVVVTDPPYGLGRRLHDGGTWSTAKKYDAMLEWDTLVSDCEIEQIVNIAPSAIVWGGNYYKLPPTRCWLAWVKANNVPTMADFELAWTNFDRPSKKFLHPIHPDGVNQHPTQKPLALMLWCLGLARTAQTVLDPFLGSGTTAVACKMLGRKCIGIELEEAYVKIACRRLDATTPPLPLLAVEPPEQAALL